MTAENTRTVCFHPLAPAFTVEGDILKKWESLGAEKGVLGYPVRNAQLYKRLGVTAMVFQRGRIVSHAQKGTFFLSGEVERVWCDRLGVNGTLGFPLEDPKTEDGFITQRFEGGALSDNPNQQQRSVDLRFEIARRGIAVRNQSKRPTCSVHVMVFLLEYHYSRLIGEDFSHLSVEFSNHFANVADGTKTDGHFFHQCEHGYDQFGIVQERFWPYQAEWPYDFDTAQRIATEDMRARARQVLTDGLWLKGRYIKAFDGTQGLTQQQFDETIKALDQGIPVACGRDHSLALVGYRIDPSAKGGGMMMLRNSYGTTMDFLGYQEESFESILQTVNDLFVYDAPSRLETA